MITTNGKNYSTFMPDHVPWFEANQVLKNNDLNDLVTYLDSHNRLTRTHLIGMGIVYGLEITSNEDSIQITAGCGITSEGFLIRYLPATGEGAVNQNRFTHYRIENLAKELIIPGESKKENFQLKELISAAKASEDPEEDIHPITNINLDKQVVMVLYDWQDLPRDSCLIDCDNRGRDRNFNLRFFLIDKELAKDSSATAGETSTEVLSAEKLLRTGFAIESGQSLSDAFQGWFDVPDCHIERIGYSERDGKQVVDLTTIHDLNSLMTAYYRVCKASIISIDKAFRQTYQLFGPFISTFHPNSSDFDDFKDRLKEILIALVPIEIANNDPFPGDSTPYVPTKIQVGYGIQYFYDYLVELIAAFNELKAALFDLMDDCPPDMERFPRYLLLGEVKPSTEDCPHLSLFRYQFYQPPIYNGNQRRKQEVRHLYERLVHLSDDKNFTLLPFYQTPVKVTPSRSRQAVLGEQAIPYYYWYPKIYPYWNYDACRKQQVASLPAYFHLNRQPKQRGYDLILRLDQSDFFRIEGHLGRTLDEAQEYIESFKQDFNLAFDLVAVRVGPKDAEGNPILNGYFDDLELEFDRLKAYWKRKKEKIFTEIKDENLNQILELMGENFLGKEDLSEIEPRLMENELLKLAQDETNYEFKPEFSPTTTGPFRLFLNQRGTRLGFVPSDETNSGYFEFELTGEQTTENQTRIIQTFATCFSIRPVTFEVKVDGNVYRFGIRDGSENIELLGEENEDLTDIAIAIEDETPYNARTLIQRYADWDALYAFLQFFAAQSQNETEKQAPELVPYYEFRALIHRYLYRLETIKQLQSFTEYARKHRGLEHLGGVPKSGTFVLVYVGDPDQVNKIIAADLSLVSSSDKQVQALATAQTQLPPGRLPPGPARTAAIDSQRRERNIVVADFCLPYQCCSTYGNINYVMARPKPFIGLSRTVFCENDENVYEFILDPPGGLLKGGDGIVDVEGQYAFQPSSVDADISEPTNLTFFYIVDGVGSSFSVLLLPVADASLSLSKDSSSFCITPGEPYIITFQIATPGGSIYRSLDGGPTEVIAVVPENSYRYNYDLSEIPIPADRNSIAASFTYVIPSTDDYCGATSDPLDITIIRTPQIEIAYPQNEAKQATGTIVHGPNGCSDLRLRVNFSNALGDIADRYSWRLSSEEVATTATTTLDLVYDGYLKYNIVLIATNEDSATDYECSGRDRANVELMSLDPTWQFENTKLPVLDNDGTEVILLCKVGQQEIYRETIRVNQAGGNFSAIGGLGITLSNDSLPCENQTQYTLNFSTTNPGTYQITYSLPDNRSFSRTVRVEEVPVGSFTIVLDPGSPETGQFYLVFNNITPNPSSRTDLIFEWEMVVGDRPPILTQEISHQFRYGENISLGDTITATLFIRSQSGQCQTESEAVTINPPFSVEQLQLYRGFIEGEAVFWSLFDTLNEGDSISIGRFRNAYLNIRTITFPENVGSVIFELTRTDSELELPITPDNQAPYDLLRDADDNQAAIWQPEAGTYRIKATPFTEADGNGVQGESLELTFSLIDSVPDPLEENSALNSLLNARLVNYRSELEALGEDNEYLRDSRAYEMANNFLRIDMGISEIEAMSEYEELTESLLRDYQLAGDEFKASLSRVLALTTARIFDRLAGGTLTEELTNSLSQTLANLQEGGLDLAAIKATWNPEELRSVINQEILDRMDRLMPE